jgi:hypothetical protein
VTVVITVVVRRVGGRRGGEEPLRSVQERGGSAVAAGLGAGSVSVPATKMPLMVR